MDRPYVKRGIKIDYVIEKLEMKPFKNAFSYNGYDFSNVLGMVRTHTNVTVYAKRWDKLEWCACWPYILQVRPIFVPGQHSRFF